MRWKETGLWLLFLTFCFGAGYLHGRLPEFRLQTAFSSPEKVKIVVFEKSLFPEKLLKLLEEKTHTEIQIEEVTNWQEARLKTVLNPGAHLLFLPSYWIPPLAREGRLRSINIKEKIDEEIAPELRKINEEKVYDVPLYWTLFEFAIPIEYKNDSFEKIIENPKIQNIETYHDPELTRIRSQQEPWNYPKVQKKILAKSNLDQKNITVNPNSISEISIHQKTENQNIFYYALKEKRPLQIFSLSIPNNSPRKITSLEIIKTLIHDPEFDLIYSEVPIGTSLNRLNKKLTNRMQKSIYLKEISFKELLIPEIIQ